MASLRFKFGMLNISIGTQGIRLGTKVGDTLVSQKVFSFASPKTKKKREEITHG